MGWGGENGGRKRLGVQEDEEKSYAENTEDTEFTEKRDTGEEKGLRRRWQRGHRVSGEKS